MDGCTLPIAATRAPAESTGDAHDDGSVSRDGAAPGTGEAWAAGRWPRAIGSSVRGEELSRGAIEVLPEETADETDDLTRVVPATCTCSLRSSCSGCGCSCSGTASDPCGQIRLMLRS